MTSKSGPGARSSTGIARASEPRVKATSRVHLARTAMLSGGSQCGRARLGRSPIQRFEARRMQRSSSVATNESPHCAKASEGCLASKYT